MYLYIIYSAGIVETYTKSQVLIWWLFHTANLFLEVKFPYHARNFKISSRKKYIHLTRTIVGILLPLVPIVIIMADTAVDLRTQNENSTSQHGNNLFLLERLGFGHLAIPALLCVSTYRCNFLFTYHCDRCHRGMWMHHAYHRILVYTQNLHQKKASAGNLT